MLVPFLPTVITCNVFVATKLTLRRRCSRMCKIYQYILVDLASHAPHLSLLYILPFQDFTAVMLCV